jgi:hypothetical protein
MAKAIYENITGNPFARGPMTGSPLEIAAALTSSRPAPHLDAELIELGARMADLRRQMHSSEDCDAIFIEMDQVEQRIAALVPQTVVGIGVHIRLLWNMWMEGDPQADQGPGVDSDDRTKLHWSLMGQVERMARAP